MNREIKFRGLSLSIGEFVFGDLVTGVGPNKGKFYILPHVINFAGLKGNPHPIDGYEVAPETVGQYTGLKDKNGKEIFEGDIWIVNSKSESGKELSRIAINIDPQRGVLDGWDSYQGEVIGNIHQNADLLQA